MKIVCKFGGKCTTNLKNIQNIKKLSVNKNRKVFVFSAIGSDNDQKLTDLLIEYTRFKKKSILTKIKQKIQKLNKNTIKNDKISQKVDYIIKKYQKNKDDNYLISRGEYLTCLIMSQYLNIKFIPAEKIIFFKNNKLDYKRIEKCLKFYLKQYPQIIIPGFYGVQNKKIKLFSRGGGDITGAVVSLCLNCDCYENYTDVQGIKQVNPKICESKQIKHMNYKDLITMTSYDANVIHVDCAKLLQNSNVVLKIFSISTLICPTVVYKTCKTKNIFIVFKQCGKKIKILTKSKKGYTYDYATNFNYIKKMQEIYNKINIAI